MGGPGLAVGEWERVCVDREALARGTGASDRTRAWNQRRFRGKEAPVGVLVRLYSTHSADRRKILYALLDFLVLHERAPLTQKRSPCRLRVSNGQFARRGGRIEGFLIFSALLGTRHTAAFVREPLSLWALDVFFCLFFPGKGFLFCMAVNCSKGARGIRRLFVD